MVRRSKPDSIYAKMKKGEIAESEYRDIIAKRKGLKNRAEYLREHTPTPDNKSMWAKCKRGEISKTEYNDWLARQKGFIDSRDEARNYIHKNGIKKSMGENKSCSAYLGVHIAERILSKIFSNVKRMPYNNRGYDFICQKGYKIEVKSSCLRHQERGTNVHAKWDFEVNKNIIADYFIFIAFDNRDDLTPCHIWLIGGAEKITTLQNKSALLNSKSVFSVSNSEKSLAHYGGYELIDKLEQFKGCCMQLRKKTHERGGKAA